MKILDCGRHATVLDYSAKAYWYALMKRQELEGVDRGLRPVDDEGRPITADEWLRLSLAKLGPS